MSTSRQTRRAKIVKITMDDRQGVEAVELIDPDTAIPIHYNDYDVFKSPLEEFKKAAEAAGLQEKMVYLAHGETYDFHAPSKQRGKAST